MRITLPSPDWMIADDAHVYVKLDSGHVLRLDAATGATLATIEIGGDLCQGLGVAFDSLWTCRGSDLVRIDPSSDEIVATLPIDKADGQGNLMGGFGRLWLLTGDGSQLVGIDPATNEAGPPIDLGIVGEEVAVGPSAVWVLSVDEDALVRVDPVNGAVSGRVDGLVDPAALDASGDVWVALADSTVRIDADSLEIATTVDVGAGLFGGVTVDGDDVWIRSGQRAGLFLSRVDAVSGEVLAQYGEPVASGGDVIVAFGAVWATAFDDGLLIRRPLDAG